MQAKLVTISALAVLAAWGGAAPRSREAPATPVPVVFIPGTTGSILRERNDGPIRWGNARSLFLPRDRGYRLALPIDPALGGASELEPAGVVREIRIGPYRRPIYEPVLRFMQEAGYVVGRLDDPRPGQTLFVFSYDWRADNVANAGLLARRLEGLRRMLGEPTLRVHLVAQSGGAHLARYFVKYGDAPLAEAERGAARPPANIVVERLVLIGTANGGALRVLRDLNRGRRYVVLGRRFAPEVVFTFRSLFQDLPVYARDLFLDSAGRPLEVDLFDAEVWRRYQWSIYQPQVARRLAGLRGRHAGAFGTPAARDGYLRARLEDAQRFHALLRADAPGFGTGRYCSLQNTAEPTPARAVVEHRRGRWRTYFTGDRAIESRAELRAPTTAAGDGHALAASQLWLSPQERAAVAGSAADFPGEHFEVILNPDLQQRLLACLRD